MAQAGEQAFSTWTFEDTQLDHFSRPQEVVGGIGAEAREDLKRRKLDAAVTRTEGDGRWVVGLRRLVTH